MANIDRNKYIVFKREDYEEFVKLHGGPGALELPESLPDAVVIRKGDQFAASALYAYASTVQTAVEIMDAHDSASPLVLRRLRDIADYFAGEADHARQMKSKLPD